MPNSAPSSQPITIMENKTMKTCTCRNCGHVFSVRKPMPFCTAACRIEHTAANDPELTIQAGVKNNDQASHTSE